MARAVQAALLAALAPFVLTASAQGPAGKVPPQLPPQAADKAKETVQAQTAPTVSLTAPGAGALYTAPGSVVLEASAIASSSGRSIAQVEFFAGSALIGTTSTAPYHFNWSNVAAGSYSLTAKATDNLGVASVSAPVAIIVNAPPTVSLDGPPTNSLFTAPAAITLTASAADVDGSITVVEFFQGTNLVGTVSGAPYIFALSNIASGSYTFSARATDDRGAVAMSAPVNVRVNAPPSVSLTSPAGNATFTAPATIPLSVQASDTDGTIARVEFYNGSTLIGALTMPPFSTNWLLVPAGSYSLTARVTDDLGATAVSESVSVTVAQAMAQIYYVHTDHLNTPRAIYNQQQQLVWRWDNIDPFGGNVPDENPSGLGAFTCNLRLPGQYFDRETNLHYNYFRDYDPEVGRYVQSDPLGLYGGINTFNYVSALPLKYSDVFGLAYFALRPLSGLPWLGPMSNNPVQGALNMNLAHEQLFFEDGGAPQNIGYFSNGELVTEANTVGYRRNSGTFNDCIMRKAVSQTPKPPFYGYVCNNCQSWAGAVRVQYGILEKDPAVRAECGCDDKEKDLNNSVAATAAAVGSAYITYRIIRMLPSLLFPPSIPANAAIP